MKAEELRIGNYATHLGVVSQLSSVGQWCNITTSAEEVPVTDLEPIPLTEEWFERLGFNDGSDLQVTENIYLIAMSDNSVKLAESGNYIGVNIQYVHQLQNLYFALTQKELTI